MEFWGVEVKPGQTVKCEPGEDKLIHLSQAALGETKDKGTEGVPVYVKFNNQKLVIGTLSAEKCPHFSYDLVFEKEFELSHTSKNASVYFCGYKASVPDDEYPGKDFSGKPEVKEQEAKPKSKAKELEQKTKAAKEDGNADDDNDDDDDDSEDSDDDMEMVDALADSDDDEDSDDDDEDESSEDEDEDTPKKAPNGKKRSAEAAPKPPADKKAKFVKAGGHGEKDRHVTTPHSVKEGGKTPVTSDKSKQQTPKSGSTSCTSCNKSFKSENALEAHNKAKHSAGK